MIICFEEELIQFIYELIVVHFMQLANNCNGLCVIKKAIIHSNNPVNVSRILQKIVENSINLVHNPFGNYAIQVALDVLIHFN